MPPRPSLQSFLSLARGKLAASRGQQGPLTFVVGNESAGNPTPLSQSHLTPGIHPVQH